MNIAIRGFVGTRLLFEDRITVELETLDQLLPALAAKHAAQMARHELHMIEIEFLDEPDVNERFFRFGTDPRGMVMPREVKL